MRREELIKYVIYHTVACGSSDDHQVFEEDCDILLDLQQHRYITETFQEFISTINEQFLAQSLWLRDEKKLYKLFYPYVYCIDKAMEVTYNLRKNLNKTVNFSSEDIEKRTFGLDLSMEVIDQMADKVVQFEIILDDIYYTLKHDEKLLTTKTRPYFFEALLWGAVYFGIAFCSRLEIDEGREIIDDF
jgi:hypothetical protein